MTDRAAVEAGALADKAERIADRLSRAASHEAVEGATFDLLALAVDLRALEARPESPEGRAELLRLALGEELDAVRDALGLSRSMIHSGERMTPEAKRMMDRASALLSARGEEGERDGD